MVEKQRRKVNRQHQGFTLAELLIVVAIIAVLVAISIPIFTTQLKPLGTEFSGFYPVPFGALGKCSGDFSLVEHKQDIIVQNLLSSKCTKRIHGDFYDRRGVENHWGRSFLVFTLSPLAHLASAVEKFH